jgi:hypothetical protein
VNESPDPILSEVEVDERLVLQLVRGAILPRLVIVNRTTNKKKYAYLSWLEGAERNLKIKVGRSTAEYPLETLREAARKLAAGALRDLAFSGSTWRALQIFQDLLHHPATVGREADCALVSESKRDSLWLAYLPPGDEGGRVRPGFALVEEERDVLGRYLAPGNPWPGVLIETGTIRGSFRNAPVVKELMGARPERWVAPVRSAAVALLLGFRDWSAEGEHLFGEALVRITGGEDAREPEQLENLSRSGREFLSRMVAYLRLHPLLPSVRASLEEDVTATAEETGLKRRDKFDHYSVPDGGRRFTVTRYVSGDGEGAVSVIPESRTPGEKDLLYRYLGETLDRVVEACALGGQGDANYGVLSLIRAKRMEAQLDTIRPIVDPAN